MPKLKSLGPLHYPAGTMVWAKWPILAPAKITIAHIQPAEERADGIAKVRGYSYELMIGLNPSAGESGTIMYGKPGDVIEEMTPENRPALFFRLAQVPGMNNQYKIWKVWVGPNWGNAGNHVMVGRPSINELDYQRDLLINLWKGYNTYAPHS